MPVLFLILGYLVSLVVGQFVTGRVVGRLWMIAHRDVGDAEPLRSAKPIRTPPEIDRWHGIAERFVYTSALVLGRPEGIAVWLAYKPVMRWKVYETDVRYIPGSAIYVVGTAVSLAFGVLGGLIATRHLLLR